MIFFLGDLFDDKILEQYFPLATSDWGPIWHIIPSLLMITPTLHSTRKTHSNSLYIQAVDRGRGGAVDYATTIARDEHISTDITVILILKNSTVGPKCRFVSIPTLFQI